ncbi:MAG: bifunctional UDP-N-acetylglucosamine diphosphorylase/glucosamine-1-phosphate N-acetyltransferase GlmU [Gammaproteobacteria bacterium]|nr:bifunctional UDP-N-acetylglucosamine diphosphorylase/glucosamine-1-phosphate N-acetyltransferase GlmU [Gammaproteobacteria bacterium]
MKLNVVVLAAGKGTRMASSMPKVLHKIAGKPLLLHVLETAHSLECENLQVVTGFGSEAVERAMDKWATRFVLQEEQLGTAHAVMQTIDTLYENAVVLILYGDVPLIKKATLEALLAQVDENSMAVLTCDVPDPTGLGRIIRDKSGQISRIVEEKDATIEQKSVIEINTGFMAIPVNRLKTWLPKIEANNAQKEYYLTDLVEVAIADGCRVETSKCEDQKEVTGINDRIQLAELERKYQLEMHEELMKKGVSLADPARFDIRGNATIAADVEIDINVILEGDVTIEPNVKIGAGCILKDCHIGSGTELHPYTMIDDAVIGKDCQLGPFARVRPGTELKDSAKLGNFVEIKKAVIGEGSKVNHLSYVGDAELGKYVNVGAGTITCNYDGVNKFKTIIGDGVFIGSNAVLVAPVEIEAGGFVAAGSTITKPVKKDQLAVGRSRQSNIEGWKRPVSKKK